MKIEEAIKRPMTYWSEDGVVGSRARPQFPACWRSVPDRDWGQVLSPGFAICVAMMIAFIGHQLKRPRMYWFALYLLLLAAVLLRAQVGPDLSWVWVGIGAPLTVLGAMRLRKFLKENPAE
jgi:hypothetical protein